MSASLYVHAWPAAASAVLWALSMFFMYALCVSLSALSHTDVVSAASREWGSWHNLKLHHFPACHAIENDMAAE